MAANRSERERALAWIASQLRGERFSEEPPARQAA